MSSPNPFDEYEAELLEQSRIKAQEELKAWEALTPAEKEAEKIRSEKKHDAWCKAVEANAESSDEDDDEDEDEDDDEDELMRKSEIHAHLIENL